MRIPLFITLICVNSFDFIQVTSFRITASILARRLVIVILSSIDSGICKGAF